MKVMKKSFKFFFKVIGKSWEVHEKFIRQS